MDNLKFIGALATIMSVVASFAAIGANQLATYDDKHNAAWQNLSARIQRLESSVQHGFDRIDLEQRLSTDDFRKENLKHIKSISKAEAEIENIKEYLRKRGWKD